MKTHSFTQRGNGGKAKRCTTNLIIFQGCAKDFFFFLYCNIDLMLRVSKEKNREAGGTADSQTDRQTE